MILEASATFRLDRLLFAREELAVERVRQRAGEARLKLEARVQSALLGLFRAHQLGCAGERDDPKTALEVVNGLVFGPSTELWPSGLGFSRSRLGCLQRAFAAIREGGDKPCGEPGKLGVNTAPPCLPMLVISSPTFKGASMR
jgi:hypothetical protein